MAFVDPKLVEYPTEDWSQYEEKPQSNDWSQYEEKSNYKPSNKSFLSKAMDYEKGLGLGLAEAFGSSGASVLNTPASIYEYFKGTRPYNIHHPDLSNYYPQSEAGSLGKSVGHGVENVAEAIFPFARAAKAFNNPLTKMLAAGLASGGTQALTNEGMRIPAGELGFAGGLAGQAIPSALGGISKSVVGLKPRAAADILQKSYKSTDEALKNAFSSIGKEAEETGINKIKMPSKLLKQISKLGPETKSFKELMNEARSGDYKDLRKLQSELWQRANKAKSSESIAENDLGDKLHELRDEVNTRIAKHFGNKGRQDLADKLYDTMGGYKDLQKTFHSHPTISKLVSEERKVPKNLISTLQSDSAAMDRLRTEHPELTKALKKESVRQKAIKTGKAIGFGGAAYELLHALLK